MLHPDTAMHAVRILGVDIANLMTQAAVYQAVTEELIELSVKLDTRSWEPILTDGPTEDAPKTIETVIIPQDHVQVLHQILNLIAGMR